MAVELNHTIIPARDATAAAQFWSDVLGLPQPKRFGPFIAVASDNGVGLDFAERGDDQFTRTHYAFLVGEDEFDAIFARIEARGLAYWADPMQRQPQEINHRDGGRGVYFQDPDGHFLEALTRPYGSGSA